MNKEGSYFTLAFYKLFHLNLNYVNTTYWHFGDIELNSGDIEEGRRGNNKI